MNANSSAGLQLNIPLPADFGRLSGLFLGNRLPDAARKMQVRPECPRFRMNARARILQKGTQPNALSLLRDLKCRCHRLQGLRAAKNRERRARYTDCVAPLTICTQQCALLQTSKPCFVISIVASAQSRHNRMSSST